MDGLAGLVENTSLALNRLWSVPAQGIWGAGASLRGQERIPARFTEPEAVGVRMELRFDLSHCVAEEPEGRKLVRISHRRTAIPSAGSLTGPIRLELAQRLLRYSLSALD
jgi:hypothetical protein